MASSHSNTPSKKLGPSLFVDLTPSEQDRQARGRHPYRDDDDDDDFSDGISGDGRFDAYGQDTYENIQKRREAAVILDNHELLMMHAQARGDSIPGTRHYFTKLLCGFQDENDSYSEPSTKKFMASEKEKKPMESKEKNVAEKRLASTCFGDLTAKGYAKGPPPRRNAMSQQGSGSGSEASYGV